MFDDIEKNRAIYVQQLETKMAHLQSEYDRFKTLAEKWEPRITVKTEPETRKTTFGLQYGGKHVHATVTDLWLAQNDQTTATSSIVDALVESLVSSILRDVIEPEVARAKRGAEAIQTAGKW
jgi:hypothetical protein